MFEAAAFALLAALTGVLARALLGPTVFDRTQAVNSAGTLAMLLLAVVGYLGGRPDFLDIVIVYGFLNIIGTVAVLKFFRYGDLGDAGEEPAEKQK
jgi:multicomponent Na+:H+ antiporter subunit F